MTQTHRDAERHLWIAFFMGLIVTSSFLVATQAQGMGSATDAACAAKWNGQYKPKIGKPKPGGGKYTEPEVKSEYKQESETDQTNGQSTPCKCSFKGSDPTCEGKGKEEKGEMPKMPEMPKGEPSKATPATTSGCDATPKPTTDPQTGLPCPGATTTPPATTTSTWWNGSSTDATLTVTNATETPAASPLKAVWNWVSTAFVQAPAPAPVQPTQPRTVMIDTGSAARVTDSSGSAQSPDLSAGVNASAPAAPYSGFGAPASVTMDSGADTSSTSRLQNMLSALKNALASLFR